MIDNKCFTTEWIETKAKELNYTDTNLIEKVIRALSLLDMLSRSGCPFHFKGGSCLMLLLHDTPHRLSIDIADMDRTSYILLDVLYEDCHYQQVERVPIQSELIEVIGECPLVNVPSIGDILGDKLTAFAPETTGIPYYKNDKLATLEIIKQLYDVGRLFDRVDNLTITEAAFSKIAPVELGYRGLSTSDVSLIYEDIRQTALNISTRGFVDKEKFALLQKGIISIRPFMYRQNYKIEDAITDASKAAYLATLLEKGIREVRHYNGNPLSVSDMTISGRLTTKLNKLRMGNPEAFFYWSLTDALL